MSAPRVVDISSLAERLFLQMAAAEWSRPDAKSANEMAERALDMACAFGHEVISSGFAEQMGWVR